MTAFKNIPAWNDFVKGKESEMLRSRRAFTERIQKLHERTLAEHSTMGSLEEEEAAQVEWDGEQAQRPKRRKVAGPLMPCPCCDGAWGEKHA